MACSFRFAPSFSWPEPEPEPEPAPVQAPAPPELADLTKAARRLLRAFAAVKKHNPYEWRLSLTRIEAEFQKKYGGPPGGPISFWRVFGGEDARRYPHFLFGATVDEVPGLPRLSAALYRCRRLAKKIDDTDLASLRFGHLVGRILGARWVASAVEPVADGKHRVAVSYPEELLDELREWIRESARPCRRGRKPDAKLVGVCVRMDELEAAGMQWKDITRRINNDFGLRLNSESARRKWWRWKSAEKSGT